MHSVFVRNVFERFSECVRIAFLNVFGRFSKCFRNNFEIVSKCFRNVFELLSKCFRNVFGMFSECFRNGFEMFSKCFRNVSRISKSALPSAGLKTFFGLKWPGPFPPNISNQRARPFQTKVSKCLQTKGPGHFRPKVLSKCF